MLEGTNRVTFQLSNLCNYSSLHKGLCPVSTFKEKQILPLRIIKGVIRDLVSIEWGKGKEIAFHDFNEPMNDPRLFWLIEYIRKNIVGIFPVLTTNGWYLNEDMVHELFVVGLDSLIISTYGKAEKNRLANLKKLPYKIRLYRGDLTSNLLNPGDGPHRHRQCYAPLSDLVIRASGNVGLCCRDYDETVVFGNLYQDSLLTILEREYNKMVVLQNQLVKRSRLLSVCKTCHGRRRESWRK